MEYKIIHVWHEFGKKKIEEYNMYIINDREAVLYAYSIIGDSGHVTVERSYYADGRDSFSVTISSSSSHIGKKKPDECGMHEHVWSKPEKGEKEYGMTCTICGAWSTFVSTSVTHGG